MLAVGTATEPLSPSPPARPRVCDASPGPDRDASPTTSDDPSLVAMVDGSSIERLAAAVPG